MKNSLILSLSMLASHARAATFEPIREDQVPAGTKYRIQPPAVEDADLFRGLRVAILASHGVEEDEITFPYEYLIRRGAEVEVLVPGWTPEGIVASRFLKPTYWVKATRTFAQAKSERYDLMVLTGGAWNAQVVRTDADALSLIRAHFGADRALAAICAGTSVLINAGIAKDRRLTGSPPVAGDLANAGAHFEDKSVVFDGKLLTSRTPDDLPDFVVGLRQLLVGK